VKLPLALPGRVTGCAVKGAGPQARKSLCVSLARLGARWFDPIAETSELPNHSPGALSFGLLGDRWAAFLITNPLVQDQPDQPPRQCAVKRRGSSAGECPARELVRSTR
jgi:hypothetical protein